MSARVDIAASMVLEDDNVTLYASSAGTSTGSGIAATIFDSASRIPVRIGSDSEHFISDCRMFVVVGADAVTRRAWFGYCCERNTASRCKTYVPQVLKGLRTLKI